jgi:hypothetical protein
MSRRKPPQVLRPLPIRVRPKPAEPVESYVRRLAHANHLRPSYLHAYLCGPPAWLGAVDLGRLAVLCGRSAAVLQRTLTELAPVPSPPPGRQPRPADAPSPRRPRSARTAPPRTSKPTGQPRNNTQKRIEQRTELFASIRHDAQFLGASIRALARRHHVHRRTILQALDSPIPPPRKKLPPRKSQVDPYKDTIDAILIEDRTRPPHRRHTIRRIWERLVDEHHAQVSYSMVRAYVARRRQQLNADADQETSTPMSRTDAP